MKTKRRAYREMNKRIGARIRQRRKSLGLSLAAVAAALGVSYQQIAKYEHGIDSISAARLHHLAHKMDVEMSCFFEEPL